jgi:hypothetical protein
MSAVPSIVFAAEPVEPWLSAHVPPEVDLEPFTPAELYGWFRGGEREADEWERLLAWSARARGAMDLAIAEGLHALRQGDRLAELGFRLDDYAREVLDLGKRAAESLARLGAELRTRPLLREALRSGRVGLRAAETVLPVAKGEAEALWVERAARRTVRELEEAVRRTGAPEEDEEEWLRLRTQLTDTERGLLDQGLEAAGRVLPGSTRSEQLEALSQEFLGEFSTDGDHDEERRLGPIFGRARADGRSSDAARKRLEEEQERWAHLPEVAEWPAPEAGFEDAATAQEVDRRLRALAEQRAGWEDLIGHGAHAIRRSGMHLRLGFATFRHFVEERLGLPPRAVEQRAELEERVARSDALQEARRQKVSYERLRVLARLREHEIRSWIARAKALTCVALRRAVEGERERQTRARRALALPLPRRVAVLVAAALATIEERVGHPMRTGSCLAILGHHFLETWKGSLKRSLTRSQQVRGRDLGFCQVPGCSHRATDAHHVLFRSRGGGDEAENLAAVCGFHHLRCIHDGHLAVTGRAPDGLTWRLRGVPFTGR